jgi:hypothetical protein
MPNPDNVAPPLPHPAVYKSLVQNTMTDMVTNLMWQQPLDTTTCATGCMQADAANYCAQLSLGGYSDWRLPTRIELVSLIDFTMLPPTIDPKFTGTPAAGFWSASLTGSMSAWFVNFANGATYTMPVGTLLRVRCVR